jgi:chitinase
MGVTPMIGANDVPGEVWTLDDADWLVQQARRSGLGRVSMWSANRDARCGGAGSDQPVSNTCSGVDQDVAEFTWRFSLLDPGNDDAAPRTDPLTAAQAPRNDPANSPYPIWRATKEYAKGDKVMWQHNVYEAKWWSMNDAPNTPVDDP